MARASIEPAETSTKVAVLVALLRRPQGARLDEMMRATGWRSQAVRAALSGAIKADLGLFLLSCATRAGRVYRAVSTRLEWGDVPPPHGNESPSWLGRPKAAEAAEAAAELAQRRIQSKGFPLDPLFWRSAGGGR